MKKISSLVLLFALFLTLGVQFRNRNLERIESEEYEAYEHEDGPSEFLKFHQGIRTRSDESKPSYPFNHKLIELQKASALSPGKVSNARIQATTSNGVIAFTERGPGNIPGRTRGLIVDPDDTSHKTWYAGSVSGGVWKTTDAGSTWQWLTPSIPNLAISCLVMAESNHNTIYAGTGEGLGGLDAVNGMGLLKSIDRGKTWNPIPASSVVKNVNRMLVDPADEKHIIMAGDSSIYTSADAGATWTKVFTGVVQDLKATPGNFSILYGSQRGLGVIKSTDGGATWFASHASMFPSGRSEVGISPVKTDRIIASAEGTLSGGNSDLYISDDGAATWSLVKLNINSKTVDYLGDQGWYDNTVAFSPYNKDIVYVGGVGVYQVTLGAPATGTTGSYAFRELNTKFLSLNPFTNATAAGQRMSTGPAANQDTIEMRFGPGLSQKAHRFLVPVGATSGVADEDYSYQDYVDVPFQVWDIKNHQQLMVSFRDQGRDGAFNLIALNATATDPTQQSREYIYIQDVPYSTSPNPSIAQDAGQTFQQMYFFWPVLAPAQTWNPSALPSSQLQIVYSTLNTFTSTVKTVSDPYGDYDGVNTASFVHPDQHNIFPIKKDDASKTFQLLMANDGGVFLSGTSTSPGTSQGEWKKVGIGYNTSQMYGADKKPGVQEYFGGMQDNATYFTPSGSISSATTNFVSNSKLGGDGFEVLWHSTDPKKMIGGSQYNHFERSVDGGATWTDAFSGLTLSDATPDNSKFPFISKLSNSKKAPDVLFTVGSEGVWKSADFGGSWTLTPMSTGWNFASFTDVEVSRANPSIVWAGSGQSGTSTLFVSTDAGQNFASVPNPVGYTLGNITHIATHPNEPNTAYALYSFAKTAKILKTTDLGQTWSDISGFGTGHTSATGFPDVAVYSLYVRPDNSDIIWAGTEIGIVESLDGGTSWSMLAGFPAVAVWDMRGQDNEIVIATHGRGIWTATLATDQNAVSQILRAGTTPQSKFSMLINVPFPYDSIILTFNATNKVKFFPPDSGTYALQISNVTPGDLILQTISYKGGIATTSAQINGKHLKLGPYQQKYYDYMIASTNFYLNGFSIDSLGKSNTTLQSAHNYAQNKNTTATLLVPIIVSSGNSSFIYDDVTLVQPGATGSTFGQDSFNDYVIAEATKDGFTWKPIANGYNSSANAGWLSAYNALSAGDLSMSVAENFDLKTNFHAGDTLLVRFRLFSNADNIVAWGWSIDNLFIQQTPTGLEPTHAKATASPNPSSGLFTINYALSQSSDVSIATWDMTGRKVNDINFGTQPVGKNELELNLEGMPAGIYLARVKTLDGEQVLKLLLRR